MAAVTNFARDMGFSSKIAYFFESGHDDANEANSYMNEVVKLPDSYPVKQLYAGHAFVEKKQALPLQAADMLAWHLRHHHVRYAEGFHEPRADFIALGQAKDFSIVVSEQDLVEYRRLLVAAAPLYGAGTGPAQTAYRDELLARFGLLPAN